MDEGGVVEDVEAMEDVGAGVSGVGDGVVVSRTFRILATVYARSAEREVPPLVLLLLVIMAGTERSAGSSFLIHEDLDATRRAMVRTMVTMKVHPAMVKRTHVPELVPFF